MKAFLIEMLLRIVGIVVMLGLGYMFALSFISNS
jgi:hypothetical protein